MSDDGATADSKVGVSELSSLATIVESAAERELSAGGEACTVSSPGGLAGGEEGAGAAASVLGLAG